MTPQPLPDRLDLPRCVQERAPKSGVWHWVMGEGTDTFQPIACGRDNGEGINMPGHWTLRQPTCVPCYREWRLSRLATDETQAERNPDA